jgi:putative beta-lactamase hcpE
MKKLVFIFFVALLAISTHAESNTQIASQLRSAGKTVESLAYDQEGCLKEKSWISCERLAKHYDITDPDMPCDSEMVTEYYKKCCDYSKNKVQLCCDKGYPKELEEKRDAACKSNDAKSCGTLASIAHRQKNYEKSFNYEKKAAMLGKTILLVNFLPICIITVKA